MFKDITVSKVKATSLNLMHEDPEILGLTEALRDLARGGHVAISPMEIQAYKLELHHHLQQ